MPLYHSTAGLENSLPFGQAGHPAWRQKRKVPGDVTAGFAPCETGSPTAPSKRLCLWPADFNQQSEQKAESLPGCLNDGPVPSSVPAVAHQYFISQQANLNTINTADQANSNDTQMDEDSNGNNFNNNNFSSNTNSMNNNNIHHKPIDVLNESAVGGFHDDAAMDMEGTEAPTPQTPQRDLTANCNVMSCSGRRPSPVSGRMYCHCSASWRGMYGMDYGYYTDYY